MVESVPCYLNTWWQIYNVNIHSSVSTARNSEDIRAMDEVAIFSVHTFLWGLIMETFLNHFSMSEPFAGMISVFSAFVKNLTRKHRVLHSVAIANSFKECSFLSFILWFTLTPRRLIVCHVQWIMQSRKPLLWCYRVQRKDLTSLPGIENNTKKQTLNLLRGLKYILTSAPIFCFSLDFFLDWEDIFLSGRPVVNEDARMCACS